MPEEASLYGECRSDSLPANPENSACTAGAVMSSSPALRDVNPRTFCR